MEGRDVHAARFVGGRRSGKSSAPRSVLLKIRLSLRFALEHYCVLATREAPKTPKGPKAPRDATRINQRPSYSCTASRAEPTLTSLVRLT